MQNHPLLRHRTHNRFLDMQYDNRYTPFLQRADLDVISFQVLRGLPKFNLAAITALVDRYYLQSLPPFMAICSCACHFNCHRRIDFSMCPHFSMSTTILLRTLLQGNTLKCSVKTLSAFVRESGTTTRVAS